ncbi:Hypothetical predicted protein [Lecanosticta acicola]|uniref:Clr5 domain-containing protein n=1 Tax=Lecanosticta acicola TaxID=111012 RepID=A0AAI8YVR7_9PEZI|nr:Hypothetical predicted protein [Lecanosticta acicola]
MARPKIVLDDWRNHIEQWAREGARKEEIQRRLQEQANIRIGTSTLSTHLRTWNVRFNRAPIKKTDGLKQRVNELFHERPSMRDEETVRVLQEEGFQISGTRALARLRREGGLYKRVEKDQEERIKEEITEALRLEFGQDFDMPEDMATRDLSVYLRSKYNIVGRDRIRKIAAELNPDWVQRRKQKGQFPRPACPAPRSYRDRTAAEQGSFPSHGNSATMESDIDPGGEEAFPDISRLAELSRAVDNDAQLMPQTASPVTIPGEFITPWLDPGLTEPP